MKQEHTLIIIHVRVVMGADGLRNIAAYRLELQGAHVNAQPIIAEYVVIVNSTTPVANLGT